MDNFTINNYEMKRDTINFYKKISEGIKFMEFQNQKISYYQVLQEL